MDGKQGAMVEKRGDLSNLPPQLSQDSNGDGMATCRASSPGWGDDGAYRVESAKMLATLLYGLQGTPYIYQGEELGMTNVRYSIEDYRDIETLNVYRERLAAGCPAGAVMESIYAKSRDNARTPCSGAPGPTPGSQRANRGCASTPTTPGSTPRARFRRKPPSISITAA